MTLQTLFSKLKGSSSSGNYSHAGRKGKRGGSAAGIMKYQGTSYIVGDHGTHTGHEGMSNTEKEEFTTYADEVLSKVYRSPAREMPLHPAQFERYVRMKGGEFEINGIKKDGKLVLKTESGTYIDILNGKHQGQIWIAVNGKSNMSNVPTIKGSKKITTPELFGLN